MQRKNIRKEKAREFLTTALYSNSNKKAVVPSLNRIDLCQSCLVFFGNTSFTFSNHIEMRCIPLLKAL